MVGKSKAAVIPVVAILAFFTPFFAQAQSEQKDSLVRLMQASSLELYEKYGLNYRKAVDATFLHNGTYLVCDTAIWNVHAEQINCEGHVQLIQDKTVLASDRLFYNIKEDLAQFRGTLVELKNNEGDVLRTHYLDYNTRDSVALFERGGSMRDKNGQIIESKNGSYESIIKRFTFEGNVNMYTDSIFVKTSKLTYDSTPNIVNFVSDIDFWKDGYMLSSRRGWYNRGEETFFFNDHVHAQSSDQEAWSDSLYFYRLSDDIEMHGHAQLQDTTRDVFGLADYIYYSDTLSQVTMRDNAAIAVRTVQNETVDTLYCGADEFVYHTKKKCDIPEHVISSAIARLNEIMADPVMAYRRQAAEAAAKAAEEEKANRQRERGLNNPPKAGDDEPSSQEEPGDDAGEMEETVPENVEMQADTVPPPPDTTKIGFLLGNGNVRMFRKDLQLRCDSLRYNDLDSIARCYKEPFVWNDGNRQYTSDSLFVLVKNGGADRASLMSNALILTQETENYFDQIKGTDVMAFFDSTSALRRFDALGGATALFYLQENDEYATVNKVECKMMSATMKDGSLEKVYYFDNPKNNAYPIVQLPPSDKRMKGFNWNPEDRPTGKEDITTLTVRSSERAFYEARPKTDFKYTDVYFPGYMESVYTSIEEAKERARRARITRDSLERAGGISDTTTISDRIVPPSGIDSVFVAVDSVAVVQDSVAVADSLSAGNVAVDSLTAAVPVVLTEKQIRAMERQKKKEAAELARSMRIARRDARWAEMDARDAAKLEKKEARKLARKQAREEMLRKRNEKQAARDEAKLQKYIDKFEKQKIRDERKQQAPSEP